MVFLKLRKTHPKNLTVLGEGQTHKNKTNLFHNSKLKYSKLLERLICHRSYYIEFLPHIMGIYYVIIKEFK
jgi:hypothetical protein